MGSPLTNTRQAALLSAHVWTRMMRAAAGPGLLQSTSSVASTVVNMFKSKTNVTSLMAAMLVPSRFKLSSPNHEYNESQSTESRAWQTSTTVYSISCEHTAAQYSRATHYESGNPTKIEERTTCRRDCQNLKSHADILGRAGRAAYFHTIMNMM